MRFLQGDCQIAKREKNIKGRIDGHYPRYFLTRLGILLDRIFDSCFPHAMFRSPNPRANPLRYTLTKPMLMGCHFLIASALAAQEPRIWTDVEGRKLKATFVAISGPNVQLRLENGKVTTVPIDRLSQEDWKHLTPVRKPEDPSPSTAESPPTEPSLAWPSAVTLDKLPEIKVVKEDDEKEEFIYETEHFEIRCDAKLGTSLIREFARLLEATYLVNIKLPLNLKPQPESGREKFLARLFKEKQDYYATGAVPGSNGVYAGNEKCLKIPMESLGVRQVGKRFSLDREAQNETMIHEATHQLMNHWLLKIPTWYCEGSAEYVTAAKYKQGKFAFTRMGDNVVAYLKRWRDANAKTWAMWHVYHLMQIDGASLAKAVANDSTVTQRNYGSSLILAFYYYHLDDEGDGNNIRNYLKDLKSGTLERLAAQRHLIRGRSYSAIEEDLAAKMRRFGLDLEFTGDAGPEFPDTTQSESETSRAPSGDE